MPRRGGRRTTVRAPTRPGPAPACRRVPTSDATASAKAADVALRAQARSTAGSVTRASPQSMTPDRRPSRARTCAGTRSPWQRAWAPTVGDPVEQRLTGRSEVGRQQGQHDVPEALRPRSPLDVVVRRRRAAGVRGQGQRRGMERREEGREDVAVLGRQVSRVDRLALDEDVPHAQRLTVEHDRSRHLHGQAVPDRREQDRLGEQGGLHLGPARGAVDPAALHERRHGVPPLRERDPVGVPRAHDRRPHRHAVGHDAPGLLVEPAHELLDGRPTRPTTPPRAATGSDRPTSRRSGRRGSACARRRSPRRRAARAGRRRPRAPPRPRAPRPATGPPPPGRPHRPRSRADPGRRPSSWCAGAGRRGPAGLARRSRTPRGAGCGHA